MIFGFLDYLALSLAPVDMCQAAPILAYAESLGEELQILRAQGEQDRLDKLRDRARQELGNAVFTKMWNERRALSQEQVMHLAESAIAKLQR